MPSLCFAIKEDRFQFNQNSVQGQKAVLKTAKTQIFGNRMCSMCVLEKTIIWKDKLHLVEEFQIPTEYINNWTAPKFTKSSQWNRDLV